MGQKSETFVQLNRNATLSFTKFVIFYEYIGLTYRSKNGVADVESVLDT